MNAIHKERVAAIRKFMGADTTVEFIDHHDWEEYVVTKNGKILRLQAHSNRADGAWLDVD